MEAVNKEVKDCPVLNMLCVIEDCIKYDTCKVKEKFREDNKGSAITLDQYCNAETIGE